MKLRILIVIILFGVVIRPGLPQQSGQPLTKTQVMDLVKFQMNSADLAKKIKDLGIDFEPTADYLESLRQAGAQEEVIQAIRDAKPSPLTREQVGELVAGGVPSQRATMLVKQRGIDFLADDQYLRALKVAGADDTLVGAVHEASEAITAELTVLTSRDAEVYLDGAARGRADAQGTLALKATAGAHILRVSAQGKKDFDQTVTLVAGQSTRVDAGLEDIGPTPANITKADVTPSMKEIRLYRTSDGKNGTITLHYPSCFTINSYDLRLSAMHSLNDQKDLYRQGNVSLALHITPGCGPYQAGQLQMEIAGRRYPVLLGNIWWGPTAPDVNVKIPISVWRDASEMKLIAPSASPQTNEPNDTISGVDSLRSEVDTMSGRVFSVYESGEQSTIILWSAPQRVSISCNAASECVIKNEDRGETVHARLVK